MAATRGRLTGMSLKTIITMFVLGSSSLAVAQPTVRDHRDDRTFTITGGAQASFGFTTGSTYDQRFTDHRHNGPRYDFARDHRSPWNRGRDRANHTRPLLNSLDWTEVGVRSGMAPSYVQLPRGEQFRYLLLESEYGRPTIESIWVRYHDGRQEEIDTSALRLSPRGVILPLHVRASTIHQIIFYPGVGSNGTFAASVAY